MATSAVSHDLTAMLDGAQILVAATCTVVDPFAARLTFFDGGAPHSWHIAVDTLLAGLDGPSGIGDVHVRPDGDEVLLILYAGTDVATPMRFPRREFAAFVQTAAGVPRTGVNAALGEFLAGVETSVRAVDDAVKDTAIRRIWEHLGDEEADR